MNRVRVVYTESCYIIAQKLNKFNGFIQLFIKKFQLLDFVECKRSPNHSNLIQASNRLFKRTAFGFYLALVQACGNYVTFPKSLQQNIGKFSVREIFVSGLDRSPTQLEIIPTQ